MGRTAEHKMALGPATGWAPWTPEKPRPWPRDEHQTNDRMDYWDAVRRPYERLLSRIETHRRYQPGPIPFAPGRYRTAKWQPYSGYGRFSGLGDILRGAYYAGRYTGRHVTPDHYILNHYGEAEYERHLADHYRKRSWRVA